MGVSDSVPKFLGERVHSGYQAIPSHPRTNYLGQPGYEASTTPSVAVVVQKINYLTSMVDCILCSYTTGVQLSGTAHVLRRLTKQPTFLLR